MLKLYNTLSRKKETFRPMEDRRVRMFTCGPSIYRRPHLGNYRSFLWEDVLQRYLEFKGSRVDRVLNFTDIEDKAISEASREGLSVRELTEGIAKRFVSEARMLRIKLPPEIPRSSTSIDHAVRLIRVLLEKGYAYRHGGDIFFDPLRCESFGRLFGVDMSRWPREKRRFRKDTYPGRRWNLGDFILWHGSKAGDQPSWDTEIGPGRPSWNIQDPAIITQHLGFQVDLCCGGVDNLYRHHDYTLAVMEAASGQEFARCWVHGEHLLVNGKKMSKSVGNILYPEDLLENGGTPDHIRFYLLYGHHRKRINLTRERFRERCRLLDDVRNRIGELMARVPLRGTPGGKPGKLGAGLLHGFQKAMDDDLNVLEATRSVIRGLGELLRIRDHGDLDTEQFLDIVAALHRIDSVLQFLLPPEHHEDEGP